jgi:hypothetical protein
MKIRPIRLTTLFAMVATLALVLLHPSPLVADEPDSGEHGKHDEHEMGHEEPHQGHRHHLAFFVGLTKEDHHDDEETFGLDYEYRLGKSRRTGLGFLVDYAGGELETTVVAVPLFFHPVGGLKLMVAPGLEYHNSESEFLIRAGIGYDFHIGKVSIGPSYAIDFVDSEEIEVYGLAIGFGF